MMMIQRYKMEVEGVRRLPTANIALISMFILNRTNWTRWSSSVELVLRISCWVWVPLVCMMVEVRSAAVFCLIRPLGGGVSSGIFFVFHLSTLPVISHHTAAIFLKTFHNGGGQWIRGQSAEPGAGRPGHLRDRRRQRGGEWAHAGVRMACPVWLGRRSNVIPSCLFACALGAQWLAQLADVNRHKHNVLKRLSQCRFCCFEGLMNISNQCPDWVT